MIAQGSLFYTDLLSEEKYLPDSYMYNVPEGYTYDEDAYILTPEETTATIIITAL